MYKREYLKLYGPDYGPVKYAEDRENGKAILRHMTVKQYIDRLNSPYEGMSPEISVDITKHPTKMRFVSMAHEDETMKQKETSGARVFRIRNMAGMTDDEACKFINPYGEAYGVKITLKDLEAYQERNVTPKADKMFLIATAFGVSVDYIAGYGDNECKSDNFIINKRFKGEVPFSTDYMKEISARVGVESIG